MPVLIALKLFAGNALGKLWSWLSHRSFWQIVSMGLAAFALVQHFQLAGERRHSAKLTAQLAKITEAGKVQRQTSERTVREVVEGQERVKTVVKTIHDAPNPEGCRTPGLDTLREVL